MTEVANIYPVNIKRQLITPKDRHIIANITDAAFGVCRSQINPNYIRRSFAAMAGGIVYMQGSELVAFCIWTIYEYDSESTGLAPLLHIRLVCSKKQPYSALDMIMYDVEKYCRQKGIHGIILDPATDDLREYYHSKGFTDGTPFSSNSMHRSVATVNAYRRRNTTRKADHPATTEKITWSDDTNISPNNLNII
jgi:hypothetical protein